MEKLPVRIFGGIEIFQLANLGKGCGNGKDNDVRMTVCRQAILTTVTRNVNDYHESV